MGPVPEETSQRSDMSPPDRDPGRAERRSTEGRRPTRRPDTTAQIGERAARSILDPWTTGADPAACSGRALPRRTWYTAYGCCLPALTGFTAPSRAGPDHQHCSPGAGPVVHEPQIEHQPGVSRVSGIGDPEPPA
jgi:hypothetical protein